MSHRWGKSGNSGSFSFFVLQTHHSHEIKRCLLLGIKAKRNLESVLKSRGIILQTLVHIVKAMIFPLIMYGCECCTIKKAEHWRIHVSESWCRCRLFRVTCKARRTNQLIWKEIDVEYSLEGLMLKLKLQNFPPDEKFGFIGKDPNAGKD